MPEETEEDGDHGHDGAREIGCQLGVLHADFEQRNKDWHSNEPDDHAAAINSDATNPLFQVVPSCSEDNPFVPQKRNGDSDDARQEGGVHIAVPAEASDKEPVQQSKEPVPEYGVESAHHQIAREFKERFGRR